MDIGIVSACLFKLEDTVFDRVFGRESGLCHTKFGGIGHDADSSHLLSHLVTEMPTAGEDLPSYCQSLCVENRPTQHAGICE